MSADIQCPFKMARNAGFARCEEEHCGWYVNGQCSAAVLAKATLQPTNEPSPSLEVCAVLAELQKTQWFPRADLTPNDVVSALRISMELMSAAYQDINKARPCSGCSHQSEEYSDLCMACTMSKDGLHPFFKWAGNRKGSQYV